MSISNRISKLVDDNGGNMSEFARRIKVTPAYISKLCKNPDAIPSERILADICREFSVNYEWLKYGDGDMYNNVSREGEIAEILGNRDEFTYKFTKVLSALDEKQLSLILKVAESLVEEETTSE